MCESECECICMYQDKFLISVVILKLEFETGMNIKNGIYVDICMKVHMNLNKRFKLYRSTKKVFCL